MISLFNALKKLFTRNAVALHEDEAYLGGSVDIYDLEQRMRNLDERRRSAMAGITYGLYPR